MSDAEYPHLIKCLSDAELHRAIESIAWAPGVSAGQIRAQQEALLSYGARDAKCGVHHLGAFRGQTMTAACLCYDYPDRSATLFVPSVENRPHLAPVVMQLLQRQRDAAPHRGVCLLQIIMDTGRRLTEQTIRRAKFELLADLYYLECPVRPEPPCEPATGRNWVEYSPATHPLFAETIQATYEQSLDCPALRGRRSIDDVIRGHQSVGAFDPRHWLLLRESGRPLAILILAYLKDSGALEIVYMGVIPAARGRRLGTALLWRANRIAQDVGARRLTLAVDGNNEPALRLYQSFGFARRATRRAFICAPAADG